MAIKVDLVAMDLTTCIKRAVRDGANQDAICEMLDCSSITELVHAVPGVATEIECSLCGNSETRALSLTYEGDYEEGEYDNGEWVGYPVDLVICEHCIDDMKEKFNGSKG